MVPAPRRLTRAARAPQIKTAKVLCVGAGGIGCELLKTLVLTGFQNIEVVRGWGRRRARGAGRLAAIAAPPHPCMPPGRRPPRARPRTHPPPGAPQIDLDTIETSNLNRQFLFRRHHVGQSKAQVAGDVVRTFAPAGTTITAHQVGQHDQGPEDLAGPGPDPAARPPFSLQLAGAAGSAQGCRRTPPAQAPTPTPPPTPLRPPCCRPTSRRGASTWTTSSRSTSCSTVRRGCCCCGCGSSGGSIDSSSVGSSGGSSGGSNGGCRSSSIRSSGSSGSGGSGCRSSSGSCCQGCAGRSWPGTARPGRCHPPGGRWAPPGSEQPLQRPGSVLGAAAGAADPARSPAHLPLPPHPPPPPRPRQPRGAAPRQQAVPGGREAAGGVGHRRLPGTGARAAGWAGLLGAAAPRTCPLAPVPAGARLARCQPQPQPPAPPCPLPTSRPPPPAWLPLPPPLRR
jgi:hypothetical protein